METWSDVENGLVFLPDAATIRGESDTAIGDRFLTWNDSPYPNVP